MNFTAKIQQGQSKAGVVLSDEAKKDFERIHGRSQNFLRFMALEQQEIKGFDGRYTLWQVTKYSPGYLTSLR